MANCQTKLPNFGSGDCQIDMTEIKRKGFVSYKDNDNNVNSILIATAATLAGLQALYDVPDWRENTVDNDELTKQVVTPVIYAATPTQGDAEVNEDDGYFKKTADGNYQFTFKLKEVTPYFVKQFKKLEGLGLGTFLYDTSPSGNARIWGVLSDDNLSIEPIRINNISVPDFKPFSREAISELMVTFNVKNPTDMNKLYGVEIADSDITSDVDFYSLINADCTVTSPATTGCTLKIATTFERGSEPVSGIVFGEVTLRRVDDETDEVVLASSASITESPSGTYAITATLTSGKSYYVEIAKSGYNIANSLVVVP